MINPLPDLFSSGDIVAMQHRSASPLVPRIVCWSLLIVAAVVLIRNAWVCDDAYISFRTVDNAVNGLGLRWNVIERVQAFTHPLWVLLLIPLYAVSGEIYYTSLALAILLSLATLYWIMFRSTASLVAGMAGVTLLILSKPFVDFSVSGLENPLSHLAVALFFGILSNREESRQKAFLLGLTLSMAALSRLDMILLLGPMSLSLLLPKRRWEYLAMFAFGMAPLVAWELFSVWYYGFPVPNTAYAKLAAGISSAHLVHQGKIYLWNMVTRSPMTAVVIVVDAFNYLFRVRNVQYMLSTIGVLLYLLYIVRVGGDFMSGRFGTPVYLLAVMLLIVAPPPVPRWGKLLGLLLLFSLGLLTPRNPILAGRTYGTGPEGSDWDSGISNERAAYYPTTGLLNNFGLPDPPQHPWAQLGRDLRASDSTLWERPGTGFLGFFAGPEIYIVDRQGLSDPLLSRLPIPTPNKWRIGHFNRELPKGYLETLRSGTNQLENPYLAKYYSRLALITRGDLWSKERLHVIWQMNRGDFDSLLVKYWQRPLHHVKYSEIDQPKKRGTRFNAPGCLLMTPTGILIELDSVTLTRRLEISVDGNDRYQVTFIKEDAALQHVILQPPRPALPGLRIDTVDVADSTSAQGYDRLFIKPAAGDSTYSLGHVRFID